MARKTKSGEERLRQQRKLCEAAWEAYNGKLALLQMYENEGIHNAYTDELRKRVRRHQMYLVNRGEL